MAQFGTATTPNTTSTTQHQGLMSSGSSSSCSSSNGRESRPTGSPLLHQQPRTAAAVSSPSPASTAAPTSAGIHQPQPGVCSCDGSRPLVPDPLTGQPICACQLESAGSSSILLGLPPRPAATGGAGGVGPAGGQPPVGLGLGLSLYPPYPSGPHHHHHDPHQLAAAAAAAAAAQPFLAGSTAGPGAVDQSSFYAAANAGHDLKESLAFNGAAAAAAAAAAAGWPYPSMYYNPYDPAMAAYPFGGYGMDLNGSRRKNATRETTATLKAWLSEHKKNPYPTKGEKIMLAIITKMTLTQVSTWFANARRRLKKENKMTWEPKNRNDDDDDDDDSDPGESPTKRSTSDGQGWNSSKSGSERHGGSGGGATGHHRDSEDNIDVMLESDDEELDLLSSGGESSTACLSPTGQHHHSSSMPVSGASAPANKPKIWSLADMARDPSQAAPSSSLAASVGAAHHHQSAAAAAAAAAAFLPFQLPQAFRSPSFAAGAPTAGGKYPPFSPARPYDPYGRPSAVSPYRYPSAGNAAPTVNSAATVNAMAAASYGRGSLASAGNGAGGNDPMQMAYNQLMSSMAASSAMAAYQQHLQGRIPGSGVHHPSSSSPVLENLEKLAALAAGATANVKSVAGQ